MPAEDTEKFGVVTQWLSAWLRTVGMKICYVITRSVLSCVVYAPRLVIVRARFTGTTKSYAKAQIDVSDWLTSTGESLVLSFAI